MTIKDLESPSGLHLFATPTCCDDDPHFHLTDSQKKNMEFPCPQSKHRPPAALSWAVFLGLVSRKRFERKECLVYECPNQASRTIGDLFVYIYIYVSSSTNTFSSDVHVPTPGIAIEKILISHWFFELRPSDWLRFRPGSEKSLVFKMRHPLVIEHSYWKWPIEIVDLPIKDGDFP